MSELLPLIPPCSYRRQMDNGEHWCDNPKVHCGGSFRQEMCRHCTLATVDVQATFFQQTNKMMSTSFSAMAAPLPAPPEPLPEVAVNEDKDCKPCQKKRKFRQKPSGVFRQTRRTIRRRDNTDGHTVVWVYWEGGARTNELQYSMASVAANLTGYCNLVICGDRPKWWGGDFIKSPRVDGRDVRRTFGSRRFQKWCDSIIKLWAIIESDLVTEDFLWMYDDTFIMKPYSFEEISRPVAQGVITPSNNPQNHSWREVRRRTANALAGKGFPIWNYSTHHPVTYNKLKLVDTINEFSLPAMPRLIETLYSNHHNRQHPARALNSFQYQKRVKAGWSPRNVPVLNVGQFNDVVRSALIKSVPNIEQKARELIRG